MASINSKKLLPSSNSTKEKNYLVPVENIIPGDTDKLKTSNDSQRKRKKTVLSEVLKVKRTVIKVEKLINNNKKLTEKDQKRKQKLLERDRFRKREQRLESKDSKQNIMRITPGLPKTGFLDSIKRFLFFTLLGAAFTKFGKHLPKISEFLNHKKNKSDLGLWKKMVSVIRNDKKNLNIGIIGKYTSLEDSYLSVKEALLHAAVNQELNLNIDWISSDEINDEDLGKVLGRLSGIVIPGGFGPRGIDGMVKCANYARTKNIPYLGLCLGMQIMVIEYSRNVLNLNDANSSEFDQNSKNHVIDFLPGQMKLKETGASMRLGNYPCVIDKKSKVFSCYNKNEIVERHRHRYEVNNEYRSELEKRGLLASGTSPDGNLVEIMEVSNHPFMIGSQFHPEFLSRPDRPHPLFYGFVSAVNEAVVEGDQIRLIQ